MKNTIYLSANDKCSRGHAANSYGECSEPSCPNFSRPSDRHSGGQGR